MFILTGGHLSLKGDFQAMLANYVSLDNLSDYTCINPAAALTFWAHLGKQRGVFASPELSQECNISILVNVVTSSIHR